LENREDGVSTVRFADGRRQNRPLGPSCRLTEVPVLGLFGISKQFRKLNSRKFGCTLLDKGARGLRTDLITFNTKITRLRDALPCPTGVCCVRYVAGRRHVRAQDCYLPPFWTRG
jgi:hypothetical protein